MCARIGWSRPRLRSPTLILPSPSSPLPLNACSRGYSDGVDLNRIFPGKKGGTASQQFAHYFMSRVIRHLDFLLDLHTASFGRINSVSSAAISSLPCRALRLVLCQ